MQGKAKRPIPAPTSLTEPFWAAARERRLAIQRCEQCGRFHHPPQPMCPDCHANSLSFETVSGRGTVYEYTIMRDARVQGFSESIPYACVAVELAEQPGLLVVGNLVGASPEDARVGLRVEVTFEEIGEGFVLPQFRPAGG